MENDGVPDAGAGAGARIGKGPGLARRGSGPAGKDSSLAGKDSGLSGKGSGLAGLRERLAALDGTLDAGSTADGRFVLTARVPLPGTATGDVRPVADEADETGEEVAV